MIMKETRLKSKVEKSDLTGIKVRLDAIVLFLMKSTYADEKGKVKLSDVVPVLYSVGYSPTEIAKLVGKNKATEITTYLYPKKGKGGSRGKHSS